MKQIKKELISLAILFLLLLSLMSISVNADPVLVRIGGVNRFSTAIKVSQKGWTSSDYVILANGLDYPDALGSAALSKKYDAPVLLTSPDVLNPETYSEIVRLGAKNVFILGGLGVVSEKIEKKLVKKGLLVKRLCGTDRYSTSVDIAKQLGDISEVIIANGDNFSDALVISPVAGIKGIPILLVSTNSVSQSVIDYLKTQRITKTYVVGNSATVSNEVISKFTEAERIYGSDKYRTNIAIINKFKYLFNNTQFFTSSGDNFPDSLSGSALAVKTLSPIVLLNNNGNAPMRKMLKNTTLINNLVLGGEGVTPTSQVNELFTAPIPVPPPTPPVAVARDLDSLVYGSPVIAIVNHKIANLSENQSVEVLLDHENGSTYMVYDSTADSYSTIPANALNIPKDPETNTNILSDEEIALYANNHAFKSNTNYYVWVDIARQHVYILNSVSGKWLVISSFACASGHNITPSLRGLFTKPLLIFLVLLMLSI